MLRLIAPAILCLGMASPGSLAASLTLYPTQHVQKVDLLTKAFAKDTGIEVKAHNGEGS